ncbi:hypothetical protein BH11PLA2_BH11PLA2_51690 [soil metagenome]
MPKTRRPWLPCPACGEQKSEVVKVLVLVGNRQRRCLNPSCGRVWLTVESNVRDTGVRDAIPVLESLLTALKSTPR